MKLLVVFVCLFAVCNGQDIFGSLLNGLLGLFGLGGSSSGGDGGTGTGTGGTGSGPDDNAVDGIHDWRIEDHTTRTHHVLLFINDNPNQKYCYAVIVDRSWEHILEDEATLHRVTDEIYSIIMDPNHVEHAHSPGDLANDFADFEAASECQGHDTYYLDYSPSWLARRRR